MMGPDGVEGDGVYCGATGAALFALSLRGTRDGRGARRTPFCGKLKSPPAFRLGRAFRNRNAKPACLSRASRVPGYCITMTEYRAATRKLNDDGSDVRNATLSPL